jgi:talin
MTGIRGCMVAPNSKSAHLGLINACEDFILPTQKMAALSKAVLPTISDEIKAIQLRNCTTQLAHSLADLKNCLTKAQEVCGSFEAEAMNESIKLIDKELIEVKSAALLGNLKPLPGESLEVCEAQLAAVSKTVGLSMAQMLTAAAQGNEIYTGIASKDTLNSLRSFTNSIRAIVACSSNNKNYQEKLIESARVVLQQSITLVNESKYALTKPNESVENQQRLAQIARTIAQSLYECVNCLPGQKDIDEVIKNITEFSSVLFDSSISYPLTTKKLAQIQIDLNQSALNLNQATNQIVIDSRKGN